MNRQASISMMIVLAAVAGCKDDAEDTTPESQPEATQPAGEEAEGATDEPPEELTEALRIADIGFDTPESVLYVADRDLYLVSNIGGSPLDEDGNGFISQVGPDGTVEQLKWIDGAADGVTLNAPKGMAIFDGTLYVTDIDVVRTFDAVTGESKSEIQVEGASFLNDLAAGDDVVFLTDTGLQAGEGGFTPSGTDAVYAIRDGVAETLASGEELDGPNGVVPAEGGGAWVVTFRANRLYRVTSDGSLADETELPGGGLDGIVVTGDGTLLVSSWEGQAVYRGEPGGAFEPVIEGVAAPADIGFDDQRSRVLIPLFEDSAVVIDPIER